MLASFDMDNKLSARGGSLDQVFGIDQGTYLLWAARKGYKNILSDQFERSRDIYISCMKEADLNVYQTMMEVVLRKAPGLYQQLKETDITQQQEKVIQAVVRQALPAVRICAITCGAAVRWRMSIPGRKSWEKGTYYGWQYRMCWTGTGVPTGRMISMSGAWC